MAINHMLVPVGLEDRDEKVLRYVCGLGAQSVRSIIAATAVDATGKEGPVVAADVDRARERLIAMTTMLRQCDMDVEVRVVTGEPKNAMLALAQQSNIDVICCGTEGKSLVDYLFSGSVSEDIFSAGAVRTMTVRYSLLESTPDPAQLGRDFGKRLVIPTDFSASATRAFLSAFDRPDGALGDLYLLHVLAEGEDQNEAEIMLRGLRDIAREHGNDAHIVMREGDPEETILGFLGEVDATGTITGQRGRGRLQASVLGSISVRMLREAPCPVVVQP